MLFHCQLIDGASMPVCCPVLSRRKRSPELGLKQTKVRERAFASVLLGGYILLMNVGAGTIVDAGVEAKIKDTCMFRERSNQISACIPYRSQTSLAIPAWGWCGITTADVETSAVEMLAAKL